jgi:hypothetical protein
MNPMLQSSKIRLARGLLVCRKENCLRTDFGFWKRTTQVSTRMIQLMKFGMVPVKEDVRFQMPESEGMRWSQIRLKDNQRYYVHAEDDPSRHASNCHH